MPCEISLELIDKAIDFHGHTCPGIIIGIRASEIALERLGHADDIDLVAVTETDMCGVDGIQVLTGCTVGKGNLIQRDLGKMAFSFFDRDSGTGFRALLRPDARGEMSPEFNDLNTKDMNGTITPEESERLVQLRHQMQNRFLELDLEEMFEITPAACPAPRPAAILQTLQCERCGEGVMESRTRRFGGQTLCISCFGEVEQKI